MNGRVVKLNLTGRRQNKKYRLIIVAGECLFGWLCTWDAKGGEKQRWDKKRGTHLHRKGRPLNTMKHQVKRLAIRAKVGLITDDDGNVTGSEMSQYAIRHFVSTELARRRVPKEQRDMFTGHKPDGSDMGAWYG